mgnify:CR=1 FL=1
MSKIQKIEPIVLGERTGPATWASLMILVRVETSDGMVGYGEAVPTLRVGPVVESIKEVSKVYVGREASDIEVSMKEWEKHDFYLHSSFESTTALSAVDIALYDILGKYLKQPVYKLLGGKSREKILVYANGWYSNCKSPEDFAEKATEAVKKGYKGLKFDPFGDQWDSITADALKKASEIVKSVRDAVGDNVYLMIEHHGRFNAESAVKIAQELSQYDPLFMEEPVHPWNMMALRDYRAKTSVRVALGERIISKEQGLEFLSEDLVDVFQPDICNIGGFTELKKFLAMTEAYGKLLAPHNAFGPVQNAATIQFDAWAPNLLIQESFYDYFPEWKRRLIKDGTPVVNGYYEVKDGPGLSINIDEGMIDEYRTTGQEEFNPEEPVWVVRGTWSPRTI